MFLHPLLTQLPALFMGLRLLCAAPAGPTLHVKIDRMLAAEAAPAAPRCGDEDFLRRVWLDLTGAIPTSTEARAFLADTRANKRTLLIDRLLSSPAYGRHMADVLDVMLMDRRPAKDVKQEQWWNTCAARSPRNKSWDEFVRELLARAMGQIPARRAAARFMLDRDGEPHLLTRRGPHLPGHEPAWLNATTIRRSRTTSRPITTACMLSSIAPACSRKRTLVLAEKADGDVVPVGFDRSKTVKHTGPACQAANRLPNLNWKRKEYKAARGRMSDRFQPIVAGLNWPTRWPFATMPRLSAPASIASGHCSWVAASSTPLDFDHPSNPPSHPELFQLLCDEFVTAKFDVKYLIRELMLSEVYQRSSIPVAAGSAGDDDPFRSARLKALTPEQLAFSLMQATGHAEAEWKAQGAKATESTVYAKLVEHARPIIRAFSGTPGQPEGQTFQATLDQALLLRNGNTLRTWLAPRPGDLADRLGKLTDERALADELFLSVLTRLPTDDERQTVVACLNERPKERPAALQDLAWALVNSVEFRFNH